MFALIVKMIMLTMMMKMMLELLAQMTMCQKFTCSPIQPRSVRASDDIDDVDSCISEINAILCKQWPWRDELWKQLIINHFQSYHSQKILLNYCANKLVLEYEEENCSFHFDKDCDKSVFHNVDQNCKMSNILHEENTGGLDESLIKLIQMSLHFGQIDIKQLFFF